MRVRVGECTAQLEEINAGLAAGDAVRVQRGAHTLKGAADIFAAKRVVHAAEKVEQLGRDANLAGAEVYVAELDKEVAELCQAIEAALASNRDG